MTVNVKLEILDHQGMSFTKSEKPLREFQKDFPLATKASMIRYMEKFNMVWCLTFHNFLNIGPIINNRIK